VDVRIIPCTREAHASAILAIFNEAILNSTALYDYVPWTEDRIHEWFDAKATGRFPVLVALGDAEELLGFASYGTFRVRPAYKYKVEHSVYVEASQRGRGVGRALLERLIAVARSAEYHVMVGAIDQANRPSIALHERLGFKHAGTIAEAGFKFGRWLDLALYQLILDTPAQPIDG
jgi:phosphinothricin acetyltransferase